MHSLASKEKASPTKMLTHKCSDTKGRGKCLVSLVSIDRELAKENVSDFTQIMCRRTVESCDKIVFGWVCGAKDISEIESMKVLPSLHSILLAR